jgi:hypothetical protein
MFIIILKFIKSFIKINNLLNMYSFLKITIKANTRKDFLNDYLYNPTNNNENKISVDIRR